MQIESKQNKSKLKENVNLSVLFSATQNSTISFLEWMSVLALTQTPPRGSEHSAQRTGRTAQQLRASGLPLRIWVLFPTPTWWLTELKLKLQETQQLLLGSAGTRHTCGLQTCMQAKHAHILNANKKSYWETQEAGEIAIPEQ